MSLVQLQWAWDAATLAALVAAGYDQQKIEWEDPPATWTEATRATTRLPLLAYVERYLWELPSDPAYGFRAVPYRTSDQTDGTPLDITAVRLRGYATVADMRDEGYQPTAHPDDRVQAALDRAMGVIDALCRQRFDAYFARKVLDVPKPYDAVHLDASIAALWQLFEGEEEIDLTTGDILVANRHLTLGMVAPDDRQDPRLEWSDALDLRIRPTTTGRFIRGRRALTLVGVFGHTALGPNDAVGELAAGSQIPLSYGAPPDEIHWACMKLASRYLYLMASGIADSMALASRVVSERTRDQSYTLASATASGGSTSTQTGDPAVDEILVRYAAPVSIGAV